MSLRLRVPHSPCCLYVARELRRQFRHGIEGPNVPQSLEKVNLQGLTVKCSSEIQQVRLDLGMNLAEGWVGSDVDRRRMSGAVDMSAPCIDTMRRQDRVDGFQ